MLIWLFKKLCLIEILDTDILCLLLYNFEFIVLEIIVVIIAPLMNNKIIYEQYKDSNV